MIMKQVITKDISKIEEIISNRKFLLVHGNSYNGLEIRDCFDKLQHEDFCDFSPNPLYEQVCEGVEIFNTTNCEMIVAVGGGSAIDVAKCIKLFCRMDADKLYLDQPFLENDIPLLVVPTTAGSGSESTRYAVLYYNGEKQSITHESIIPNFVILSPSCLKNLSTFQKKCTMLDALGQAIESWWSVNSTPESIEFSKKAISLIISNWEEYIFENREDTWEKILDASNYAGRAINITATTAAHAMSYKVTSIYHLPHGYAVAICLKEVWRFLKMNLSNCNDKRGEEYLQDVLNDISGYIDVDYFDHMLEKLDIVSPVSADRASDIEILSNSVNVDRLKNFPVNTSKTDMRDMYERIIK